MELPDAVVSVESLEQELERVNEQISGLTIYRMNLQYALGLHGQMAALRPKLAALQPELSNGSELLREARAAERLNLHVPDNPDDAVPGGVPAANSLPTTIEMAKQVIQNLGRTLTFAEIRQAIWHFYGLEPAKSLEQMLYKRAQRKKGFYKTADGQFGLVDDWHQAASTQMASTTSA